MNKQIKIRREGDQVIVERVYKVVSNRTITFDHRPNIDLSMIKDHVIQALKARMNFCLKQLDVEILPSQDKVFNEMGAIFSPSKGLYFNQKSFESMESALEKIENNPSEDMFNELNFVELDQITKALISFNEKLPEKEAHYLSGLVIEALMVSSKEPKTVLRTSPKPIKEEDVFGQ